MLRSPGAGTIVAWHAGMLEIGYRLAAETGATWVLRLDGRLQGERVRHLRREWRKIRGVAGPLPIMVDIERIEFVDATGERLLAEMRRAGVHVARRV